MSVPTTYDCPHHSNCIHFLAKRWFVGPCHLPKFWGKKPKATTKVTPVSHQIYMTSHCNLWFRKAGNLLNRIAVLCTVAFVHWRPGLFNICWRPKQSVSQADKSLVLLEVDRKLPWAGFLVLRLIIFPYGYVLVAGPKTLLIRSMFCVATSFRVITLTLSKQNCRNWTLWN